ncbi:MAG: periplasmic heavy metal sensor [Pseudomonadota bacterium]
MNGTEDPRPGGSGGDMNGATRRTPAWVKVLLAVSLGLNLMVAGLVVGAVLNRDAPKRGPASSAVGLPRDVAPLPLLRAFDAPDQRSLARAYRERAGGRERNREELRALFDELQGHLRANPFDPDAFAVMLERERRRTSDRQDIGTEIFVNHLAQLPYEDRLAYADRLSRMLRSGK